MKRPSAEGVAEARPGSASDAEGVELRSDDVAAVGSLAEPGRRRLYDFVVSQPEPVDRDSAAAGVGISRRLAAFHLDRLAAAGLLDVTFRRRSGRSGPGAGRPAKFYSRASEREVAVSLPPRRYGLAAEILAEGAEGDPLAVGGILDAARRRGARIATETASPDASGREGSKGQALLDAMVSNGYEPVMERDGTIRLRNCPFHALVDEHRALTCSMNLALLEGVADELAVSDLTPTPDPRPGYCCVAFVPTPTDHDL